MHSKPMNPVLTLAMLLTMIGQTGIASAHSLSGTLGKAAGATDLYQVTCSTDSGGVTGRLTVEVLDAAPVAGPKVSVQVVKGSLAGNSTDPKDGDYDAKGEAVYSPAIHVYGGDGPYYMLVDKTSAGAEIYAVEYHCETANGEGHTGSSSFLLQDQ